MHIGVDGSIWGGQERGVAVSTRRLWSSYLQQTAKPHVTIFAAAGHEQQMPEASFVAVGPLSPLPRIAWQQLVLPRLVREKDIEILHCPGYTAPVTANCRVVVTVHDLIVWTHPQLVSWRNIVHFRVLVGRSIRRAEAICVPTDFVRRMIIERFGISPRKVFVVPWGVNAELPVWSRETALSEVERRFGVNDPFVLFCGCIERKKNLETAIQACAQAGLRLLIVGPSIAGSSRLLSHADQSTSSHWNYLGYVSSSDLSALYSAAEALIAPSYVEGFGLPAIEAMSLGCPVVAADFPVFREVCGAAALYAPCSDSAALARVLQSLVTDRALRNSLAERGRAHAQNFTWTNSVSRFSEALHYAAR
jgi:glycosyltransferase involved in cell wall biosynthesis